MPGGESAAEGFNNERAQRGEVDPNIPPILSEGAFDVSEEERGQIQSMGSPAAIRKAAFEDSFGKVQSAAEAVVKPLSPELNVLVIELQLVDEEITKLQAEMGYDSSPEKRTRLIDLVNKGMVLNEQIKKHEERE